MSVDFILRSSGPHFNFRNNEKRIPSLLEVFRKYFIRKNPNRSS